MRTYRDDWLMYVDGWLDNGSSIRVRPSSSPRIMRRHVDGPLLTFRDGQMHWLTLWERFLLMIGKIDAIAIERKRRPNLLRALGETP